MMLWFAKSLFKRIEKLKIRILIYEIKLNKYLKSLTYDEYFKYGVDTGLIADDDYYKILKLREKEERRWLKK